MTLSLAGTVHTAAASLSLVAGLHQFTRPRGGIVHRRVGFVYAGALTLSNLMAFTIYQFSGHLNVFHALAAYSLVCVAMALRPMLTRPRPYQWKRIHYQWTAWSYVGLWAAAVTEFLLRVVLLPGWLSAAIGTPPVVALGGWLIYRFAPPRRPAPTPSRPTECARSGLCDSAPSVQGCAFRLPQPSGARVTLPAKLRAGVQLTLSWALGWAAAGLGIAGLVWVFRPVAPPGVPGSFLAMAASFAVLMGGLGASVGGGFAFLLASRARAEDVQSLPWWRVATWGAFGGLAGPATYTLLGAYLGFSGASLIPMALMAVAGAGTAAGMVGIARRPTSPTLPGPEPDSALLRGER